MTDLPTTSLTEAQRRFLADLIEDQLHGIEVVIQRASKNGSSALAEYWQELDEAVELRDILLAGLKP